MTACLAPIGCELPDPQLSSRSSADTVSFQSGSGGYAGTVDGLIKSDTSIGSNDFTSTNTLVMNNTVSGYETEALIKWSNLSLPAGSTVTGAQVSLTWEDFAGGHVMRAYYVKNAWDTSAKWVPRTSTQNWAAPGAKGVGTDITSSTPAFSDSTWTAAGVQTRQYAIDPAVVQGWIDNPSTNQGIVVTNAALNKQLRVYTSRNATLAQRPQLTITYSAGGGGGTCWSVAAGTWRDDAFTAQTTFTAEFDATPSAINVDEVMGLSSGSANQQFTNLQAVVRFYTNGRIEARNGAAYAADTAITYAAATSYHFKLVVDVAARRYSVYVTPSGGTQVTLAANYAFRSDAPTVSSLNNLATQSGSGTLQVCNLSVTASPTATYNSVVLADNPVAFWGMSGGSTEADLSGRGRTGTYVAGPLGTTTMPNGDPVVSFNGSTQYLTVPSHASLSIPTTHKLTWEAWIKPVTLEFPSNNNGYVNFLGKCETFDQPTCEWEGRMYNTTNPQGRCNRLSAYAFNPTADFGSGADWQPTCGLLVAGHWYHVVGEYTTLEQYSDCSDTTRYPGQVDIWVNGVRWDHFSHGQTGCMGQYGVVPVANGSSFRIGTVSTNSFFQGAVGKVAIYDYLLSDSQIKAHYLKMSGQASSGSCGDSCTLTNP